MVGQAWGASSSGQVVSAYAAENLSTVSACVGAISSGLASLPPYVYRREGSTRQEAPDHPVSRLLRRPNAQQTWPDWIETTLGSVLLHGNAVSVIETDGAGRVTGLRPIPWGNVTPILLASGALAFDITEFTATFPLLGGGPPRRYLASEVFHLRDRSDDGYLGRSRLSRAPDVLGNAMALQHWSGSMWENQATPSGALESDKALTEPQMTRVAAQFRGRHTGTANARSVMILDNGLKWRPLSISPEDAEVLESRRFTTEELCRLFQVPPPIIQAYQFNTFTNASQASLWFAQLTLSPWARKIEAEFARSVFGPGRGYELEIDLSGLMRGDYEARWKAHEIAVKNGILSVAEVREIEGWNPAPRGSTTGATA
ncbi:phage portal protein [Paracraurococcus ruber]|uniref:Phage portal protein n=2 Tax=Paracraurococcus ruber TaxID=77675 RepID=A0ABS1D1P8_9PROT|nr:phage portal protein [Paracraurococcus ruber]MBK1660749.1 phage portal protein [Paracraurococcus ruber]TDG27156.1 phage portal protein [Paracraurococcus ruber]